MINVQIVKDAICNCDNIEVIQEPLEEEKCFIDIQSYINDCDGKVLVVTMNSLIKENPDVRWEELSWFIDL